MWTHFSFANGSNPYIAMRNTTLWDMITRYETEQEFAKGFIVTSPRGKYPRNYNNLRAILRDFAIQWQSDFPRFAYSWSELSDWGAFFEEYGKKYGLLREFRENGII